MASYPRVPICEFGMLRVSSKIRLVSRHMPITLPQDLVRELKCGLFKDPVLDLSTRLIADRTGIFPRCVSQSTKTDTMIQKASESRTPWM